MTSPRGKITRITEFSPADDRSPFYDPSGTPMKPLARIVMTRQRVYEKSCTDTSLLTEEVGHPDNSGDALRRNSISKASSIPNLNKQMITSLLLVLNEFVEQ